MRSNHYHGDEPLTYSSTNKIEPGSLVYVPLRHEVVLGIVFKQTASRYPKFSIKSINRILENRPLPAKTLELMQWLKSYYPAPIGIITQLFIPTNTWAAEARTVNTGLVSTDHLPPLTTEQKRALKSIKLNDTYLLHGRTGSGKTRMYLELAADSINAGRSVVILTPEISLTAQLDIQFRGVFAERVIVLHSTLTPKQRSLRWMQLLNQPGPKIVIGPRSALFSPLDNIGLIVVDEEHEPAYKQEQAPYYVTGRVASQLRNIHQAKLVLGSATPLIQDYYLAAQRHKPIVRLTELAQKNISYGLNTHLVDCHDRSLFSRSSYLSDELIGLISSALSKGNQTMLYLNRRGTARVVVCDNCDWQAKCPRCDLPLTYHGDNHTLRCHVCGYSTAGPVTCPSCKKPSVKYLSIGTKAVVDEVNKLFPTAKIERFDADNIKAERLEQRYEEIRQGGADIIVGTQMLAKGLDLPRLSIVGVLLADTSLQLPDYTVNERTYQLLQQVVGRVGRGHVEGHAIIQTYQPENDIIADALADNWDNFYNREIKERERFNYPPFMHMLKLTVQRASPKSAEASARKLALSLPKQLIVEGPAPSFHEKLGNKYRWQLVIKSKARSDLINIIKTLPAGWSYDIDPANLI